jgi:hypothetical protein
MSQPVKNGKRWRHRIMVDGVRRTGTFDTKAAALKWEAQQRVEITGPVSPWALAPMHSDATSLRSPSPSAAIDGRLAGLLQWPSHRWVQSLWLKFALSI